MPVRGQRLKPLANAGYADLNVTDHYEDDNDDDNDVDDDVKGYKSKSKTNAGRTRVESWGLSDQEEEEECQTGGRYA